MAYANGRWRMEHFADDEAESFFVIGGKEITAKLFAKALHSLTDKLYKVVKTLFAGNAHNYNGW